MTWEPKSPVDRGGCILVIDDQTSFRKLIETMLRKAGYRVLEAGNGAEALTVLKARQDQSPVDVILCDIRMPEMDGSQAIPAFREQYPSVPVVVLTGFPDAEMATMLLRQGVSDYTPKPIEQEKLLAVIQKAMEQRMAMITSTFKV